MAVYNRGISQAPGVMAYPGTGSADGLKGDHLIISPPYNITSENIDLIVRAVEKAVTDTFEIILNPPKINGDAHPDQQFCG